MILDFQFTLDDYRRAFTAHRKKGASLFIRWLMRLCIVAGTISLLVFLLFILTGQHALNVVLPPLFIGAGWLWIGLGGSYQLSARIQFSKNPVLREPRRLEITDEGVTTDAGIASSQMSWKAYLRFVEWKDSFLLYTSPVCFVIIPKRVLQPAQVDELRQLLKMNVGKDAALAVS
jgi:hypothetical protein